MIAAVFILLFLAITFLQSGFDKLIDWKGNVAWLKGHFSKTFMRSMVPLALGIILILEVIAGILSLKAIWDLTQNDDKESAIWAGTLSCITLLCLLFGQRIAKDYDGARTIVIYLIPTFILLYII